MRRAIGGPLCVGCLAFCVRLVHLFAISTRDPTFDYPLLDSYWHIEWARSIALGLWKPEPFFRAPLYPFFLGLLLKVFGLNWFTPRLIQCLIGSATCVLVAALGSRLAGKRAGLISGILAAFYGPFIHFDSEFLIPVVLLPLLSASLLLLVSSFDEGLAPASCLARMGASGLLGGVAALARANAVVLCAVALVWLMRLPRGTRRVRFFAMWFLSFSVPVVAVTWHNIAHGGGPVLIASQGGVNFWIGNNPSSDGKTAKAPATIATLPTPGSKYVDSVQLNATAEAERRLGRRLTPWEVSTYWYVQGIRFVQENPLQWAHLTMRKLFFVVNGYELPSNRDLYSVRRYSRILKVMLWDSPVPVPFGLLLPLAASGMVICRQRAPSGSRMFRLLLIYLFCYGVTVVGFFVTSRHRLPMVLALIPFAAVTVESLGGIWHRRRVVRRDRRTVSLLLAFLGTLVIAVPNWCDIRAVKLREYHMQMGERLRSKGRYEDAIDEFRAALDEEPQYAEAMFNIGSAYGAMGEPERAKEAMAVGLAMNPESERGWIHVGNLHFREGDATEAGRAYRKALTINDRNPLTHYVLALSCLANGDHAAYRAELLRSHEIDPTYAPANLHLAELYLQEGAADKAHHHLERAKEVTPVDPQMKALWQRLLHGRLTQPEQGPQDSAP